MSNREKDPKQLPIGDLRGIVGYLHRFWVASVTVAYQFVVCGFGRPARVPRRSADHALYVLEDGLYAPEAATRDNRGLLTPRCCQRGVHGRAGDVRSWPVSGLAGDHAR